MSKVTAKKIVKKTTAKKAVPAPKRKTKAVAAAAATAAVVAEKDIVGNNDDGDKVDGGGGSGSGSGKGKGKGKDKGFGSLGLDGRILQGLKKIGIMNPTIVQEKSIPIAMEKKDILLRAKTGSGKTLAFLLPMIENLLRELKQNDNNNNINNNNINNKNIKILILVPTRELIVQITKVIEDILYFCNDLITFFPLNGIGNKGLDLERPRLLEKPDILICTPGRLANHLKVGNVTLTSINMIVIDEADLMMTHEFEPDIKEIVMHLSGRKPQIFMCSATLNPHTNILQKHFLVHHPSIIQVDKVGFDENKLSEYYLEVEEFNEKFLVIYALLKLKIIKGKSLVFVHSVDLAYRLKLFLEKFLIPSAVLNPTLPYNSRQSIIDKFNRGLFTYLITTDALNEYDDKRIREKYNKKEEEEEEAEAEEEENEEEKERKKDDDIKMTEKEKEEEYDFEQQESVLLKELEKEEESISKHIKIEKEMKEKNVKNINNNNNNNDIKNNNEVIPHRGIDFREVAVVINMSCPASLKTYIHRIGRTARAGHYGVAITIVTRKEMPRFRRILFSRIRGSPSSTSSENNNNIQPMDVDFSNNDNFDPSSFVIQKLPLTMNDLQPFRYRCDSIRCSITTQFIKHARLNELKMEVLNSKRLRSHFKERQREYELLRHDKMLQPAEMVKPHLSHISSYLLADTKLKAPKRWHNANYEFKKVFGVLPPRVRETRLKKILRKKMKKNPLLRKQVEAKRRFNLKHPDLKRKKNKFSLLPTAPTPSSPYGPTQNNNNNNNDTNNNNNNNLFHSQNIFNKATLFSNNNNETAPVHEKLKVPPRVNHWKSALKQKLVQKHKRKPSLQGMSKGQIHILRRRAKLKKLSKRRK